MEVKNYISYRCIKKLTSIYIICKHLFFKYLTDIFFMKVNPVFYILKNCSNNK